MTGYMHAAFDKRMDIRNFLLLCSRGMGATILMRDEPLDVLPPEAFEVEPFYAENVRDAEAALAEWKAMPPAERERRLDADHAAALESHRSYNEKERAQADYLTGVLKTLEHAEPLFRKLGSFWKFVQQQLLDSLHFTGNGVPAPERLTADGHYEKLSDSLAYATKSLVDERQRVATRNEWLRDLYAAIAELEKAERAAATIETVPA